MGVAMFFLYPPLEGIMHKFFAMAISAFVGGVIYVIVMVLLKGLNRHDGERMPLIGKFFRGKE